MKRAFLFALSLMAFVACSDDDNAGGGNPGPSITMQTQTIPTVAAEGGSATISFTASDAWTAEVTPANDWLTISPTSGVAGSGSVNVTVKANESEESRSATIKITVSTVEKSIAISQKGIEVPPAPQIANNEIWYTTSDGEIVEPNIRDRQTATDLFGQEIVSNVYADGKGVITFAEDLTTINDMAFAGSANLESITFPAALTKVGNALFCPAYNDGEEVVSGIKEVTITANADLFVLAFQQCYSIEAFHGPFASDDELALISDSGDLLAYALAKAVDVTIPEGVVSIGGTDVFVNCTTLKSVTFPSTLTQIGPGAFLGCRGLTAVELPASVKKIDKSAFSNCTGITAIEFPASVEFIGDGAFHRCTGLTSLNIPGTVKTIDNSAFENCHNVTSLTLGEGIETIGSLAFANVPLTEVTIPNSVESLGGGAFNAATLQAVHGRYASEDGRLLINEGVLLLALGDFNGATYSIPMGVTEIGANVFADQGLVGIVIAPSVTKIGNDAFRNCRNLVDVNMFSADNLKEIGNYAFQGCENLREIKLPEGVTTIGIGALERCFNLEKVVLPSTTQTLGNYMLANCQALKEIYCSATVPPTMGTSVLNTINNDLFSIYVPTESVDAYKSAEGWREGEHLIVGYNF